MRFVLSLLLGFLPSLAVAQQLPSPTFAAPSLNGSAVAGAVGRKITDKLGDVISVRDFGVKGDGTTDDTTALKALATRVAAIHKAHVFFPCGTYKITDTITWDTANNLALEGRNSSCAIINLAVTSPSIPAFIVRNGDGSLPDNQKVCGGLANQEGPCGTVSHFSFSRPAGTPVTGNAAIASYRDINSAFSDLRIVGYYRGIEFHGSYAGRVTGSSLIGTLDASIWFANDGSGNNAVIERNYLLGGGVATSTGCIDIGYQAQAPQIINNDIEFCHIGIRSRGSHGTRVAGNYIESSVSRNIVFEGSNSTSSTTGFNASWRVENNLLAKPSGSAGDTYEKVDGIVFDGNVLPNYVVNWSTTALRVALGRTNTAFGTGSVGTPTYAAPFASGMLAVGAPGGPATFTSNGPDLFVNTGTTNSSITLRPDGTGSTSGEVSATTFGFKMNFGAVLPSSTFAALPTCNGTTAGLVRWVTDSTAVGYNANIVGGGTSSVIAFCNGSTWTAH